MQKPWQKSASNTKASAKANLSRVLGDPRNSFLSTEIRFLHIFDQNSKTWKLSSE
jgi:hypothetical protein